MREPIETSELVAFTRTIEAKSLSRAAAELGVPRATIGRRLARLEERLGTRLIRRYDVALRASSDIQPGLVARTISRDTVIAVASPAYLAERGTPRTPKDLRDHRCLTSFARGELPQSTWPVGHRRIHVDRSFSSNDLRLLREAALRGLGIALLPKLVLADLIQKGKLVQVLPGVIEKENRVSVVFQEREFLPPHVRAFIDALVAWGPALERGLVAWEPRDYAPKRRKTKA